MKFSTTVKEFRDAYMLVCGTLDKKKDAPGSELYIQAIATPPRVLLFSTDGMALTVKRLDAKVAVEGSALCVFKDMGAALAALQPGDKITFEIKGNRLHVRCGFFRPTCSINAAGLTLRKELLQSIPFKSEPAITLSSEKLRGCLERTMMFAAAKQLDQASRDQVLIVSLDGAIETYATNSKVVAKARHLDADVKAGFSMPVPMHGVVPLVHMLASMDDTQVRLIVRLNEATGKPSWLYFQAGPSVLGVALMDGGLPSNIHKSEDLVGEVRASLTMNRESLLNMLTRCTPFIAERAELSISLDKNILTVYDQIGDPLDKLKGTGADDAESCEVTLSKDWFQGAVKAMSADQEVTLYFGKTARKIVWLKGGADDTGRSFYLIGVKVEAKKNLAPVKPEEDPESDDEVAA